MRCLRSDGASPEPRAAGEAEDARVLVVPLVALETLSAVRVFMPPDARRPEAREKVRMALDEVEKRFSAAGSGEALPLLREVEDLKLAKTEPAYAGHAARVAALEEKLAATPPGASVPVDAYAALRGKRNAAAALRSSARALQTLVSRDDLRRMRRVLRKLGHVSAEGVIALKGRAACELNTADELVVAELLLDGVFGDLDPATICALLSCVVYGEARKADDAPPSMRKQLEAPRQKLIDAARLVARARIDAKIELDEDEYVEKFNPALMEATFQWASGAKFVDVMKVAATFEGSVIRAIRRLDELLRQLASAAHAIGNFELKNKFDLASTKIKRDIVFAASLYL